jgi:hypothetical protein
VPARLILAQSSHKGKQKPKVVDLLGVVNLPKGRFVLKEKYPNAFWERLLFKYETLREGSHFSTRLAI